MKTYIVHGSQRPPKASRDEIKQFYQNQLFEPLATMADQSNGQIVLIERLLNIGMAVIEATDEGTKNLEQAGYQLTENKEVKLIW